MKKIFLPLKFLGFVVGVIALMHSCQLKQPSLVTEAPASQEVGAAPLLDSDTPLGYIDLDTAIAPQKRQDFLFFLYAWHYYQGGDPDSIRVQQLPRLIAEAKKEWRDHGSKVERMMGYFEETEMLTMGRKPITAAGCEVVTGGPSGRVTYIPMPLMRYFLRKNYQPVLMPQR